MTRRAWIGPIGVEGSEYDEGIRAGLDFVRFGSGLPPQPRVFIKPNLTFPSYRAGVMTSPAALEAAILAIQDYTSHIWVGDSNSGGYNPFAMEDVYRATGIDDFAKRHGVHVVNLSALDRTPIDFHAGDRPFSLDLPRLLVEEIDVLVTMPVPKVHNNTGVSLTFKNQWGCIPEPKDRLRLHPFFTDAVLAVNSAVKAGTAIIDGRFGLNRTGPMKGEETYLGWLAVADDIGTGARVACELMQVRVEQIRHLRAAQSRCLIPPLEEIECNGPLEPFIGPRFYVRRSWTDYPGLLAFRSPAVAHLAYFSRWAKLLHRLLYLVREPMYDYSYPAGALGPDDGEHRPS